ncbi:MAG TPA: MFS transporter [Acidimicrobiales bacterium]|nr:MFS transporter [Acidimicrobiales bacterium]
MTRRSAFVAVAYTFVVGMCGTTLPSPLYPLYQREFGFGELTVTLVYATYAFAVLATLLFAGGVSDLVGRRKVLAAALAFAVASAVVFLVASDLALLFVGRALSGLSAGLLTGSATAALLDLAHPGRLRRASLVATLANMGGLGLGPLAAGLLASSTSNPLKSPFVFNLAILVPAVVGVWLMPEPVVNRGRLRLRTTVGLPHEVRPVFIPAALAGFAGFVVLGVFSSVGPAALGHILSVTDPAAVGAVLFGVFLASTVGQTILHLFTASRALRSGCVVLVLGMGLLAAGLQLPSLALLITGGLVGGFGQGLSFSAGMSLVNAATAPHDRAKVTSLLFLVLYVGISIPVIGVGIGAREYGLLAAGTTCAVAVALLASIAFMILKSNRLGVSPKSTR